MSSDWDVVVVGAGAAGLLAAARAAERGRRVLLLEKNNKPGVKILMSGGTRCNLTHAGQARDIVSAFRRQGPFLHSALAALGPDDVVALFEAEGVPTKVEPGGKVFPSSNRAFDVLAALRRKVDRSGAMLSLGEPVLELGLTESDARFSIRTAHRTLAATRVLLTTGGRSYPGCGTVGDGYVWAERMGHRIVPPCPALVPIKVHADWAKALQGVTVPDVQVWARSREEDVATKRGKRGTSNQMRQRGSFLFAHFGLSGPVVLDVSRAVAMHAHPRSLVLECDFLPTESEAGFQQRLRDSAARAGKKQVVAILTESLPRRLAEALVMQAEIPLARVSAELTRDERTRLTREVKATEFAVTGTLGFEKAEVTAGGVALDEIDSRTMQSKIVPNLFVAGEILDLDGPIGGYNFQAAFSTGWLAAENL